MADGAARYDTGEGALESPATEDGLYHSRGPDVLETRPLLTGDVFRDIDVPGLDDGPGLAIVVTHPCSMRKDGVALIDRILVARIEDHQPIPLDHWPKGYFKLMPLPGLLGQGAHAALFNSIGLVRSGELEARERVACLSESGINLLQQRLIFHLTRFVAPTFRLHESCVTVFREVELHDEWAEDLAGTAPLAQIAAAFHTWLRGKGDGEGLSRQERLADEQQVVAVRQEMRGHIKASK